MALNFDAGPYYDDFDPSKNFHRILFKPGFSVQARELTQSQTILQNQISEFASAIYSQNTPVTGGQVTTNFGCYYLKLQPTYNGATVVAANFANQVIFDYQTGTILARVIATVETTASGSTAGDPPTLIVSYLSGNHFTDGLTIQTTGETTFYATIANSDPVTNNYSTGLSSTASVANGVFYIVNGYSQSPSTGQIYSIGNFVDVTPQTIVLDKYDNTPNCRIGLEITETIYDYVNDASLLDPAIGASNYQAPGADRYVINLSLVSLPLTLGNDQSFIELVRVVNGQIVSQVDGTVYSTLDDYFAKRDYETNGDYIVNDFKLTPSANAQGVASEYDLGISKGIAYVHGYRIEAQSGQTITNKRARDVNAIVENAVYVDYGNYFTVDTVGGIFDVGQMQQVNFHCVGSANVNSTNATTYNSTLVGTGFMRGLEYVTGTGSNTKSYIYNAYVSDFTATTVNGTASGGTPSTLVVTDSAGLFSSVANAYYGLTITATTGAVVDVRTVTNYQVSGSTKTFTVSTPFTVNPSGSTAVVINFNPTNVNSIVTANSTYALTANANINAAFGKYQGVGTNPTVYNNSGSPELVFPIGYPFVANVSSSSYYSTRVYRNKTINGGSLTLYSTSGNSGVPLYFEGPTGAQTGTVNQQNFIVINTATGNVLDFTTSGNTINIDASRTFATITSATYSGMTVDIIANVSVNNGDNAQFVLKAKNLVKGNTAYGSSSLTTVTGTTSVDLTKAQALIAKSGVSYGAKMSLYVNDIKKIRKVYDTGTTGASISGVALSTFTDVTNYYTLDNGQRDSHYDFGSVSLIPGAPLPSGNILVVFDYYSHSASGDGYFSIQSYTAIASGGASSSPENYPEIPVYTAKDGNFYKLSDCVDFRPCRVNAQTAYIWEFSTGSQPSGSSGLAADVGMLIPQNLTNYQSNYGYYLGRQDRLVLTKDKSFQIVQGTPSVSPSLPTQPTGSLLLANLLHDPYTAYVPGEGPAGVTSNLSINKVLHKRWAKTDITDLETRINNLEYYTSLSVLESTAASTQVMDNHGVSRPNYGILVDDFSGYSTADTGNADYAANINTRKNQMSAIQTVNNFQLQNPVVLNSVGTSTGTNTYTINSVEGTQTNIFTLPYTTKSIASQPLATSVVSVNPFAVVNQQGVAKLTPPMDNWVDNTQAPALLVTDPSLQVYQATNGVNLLNAGDFATIPGTSSTISTSASVMNHGNPNVNSPFGPVVGYTASTTQTYASQLQNTTSGAYSPVSSTFASNNGYLTNIAVLPYIRPQQIVVQAQGLLVNTPLTTWFDGTNVDQYITSPNTIELTNVSLLNGASVGFQKGDVVGFYISNSFYPVARVLQVYNYPNGTSVRLYVAEIVTAPNSVGSTSLQNGTFDVNGTYVPNSATARGTVPAGAVVSISLSGEISGVGGGYANTLNGGAVTNLYLTPITQGYCSFLNQYGVWGDPNNSTSYIAAFPTPLVSGATYTLTVSSSGSATVYQNGTSIGSSSSSASISTSTFVAASSSPTISWNATSSGSTESAFAMTITDSSGTVVFSSLTPPNLTYTNVASQTVMYGGGAYFTNANTIYLGPNASSVNNYYANSQISITTKYVYSLNIASTYVPPPAMDSGGGGSGGDTGDGSGYGCVVATELAKQNNGWSKRDMLRLMSWSFKELDKTTTGNILHRGYQVIGPNFLLPIVKKRGTISARYIKWSFNQSINMLRGKEYNKISIPNSLAWMSAMFVTGLYVVTKEQAKASWKSLFKKLGK
jgi:hypothetical protein